MEDILNNLKTQAATSRLIRLEDVLKILPVSKSTWYDGIKKGLYPKPIKIGSRISCWRYEDIVKLIN